MDKLLENRTDCINEPAAGIDIECDQLCLRNVSTTLQGGSQRKPNADTIDYSSMLKEIFCTCIIPTVGRVSLSRAVESVLAQSLPHPEFEVVVVNDSSKPLPFQGWQASAKVRLIETHQRERSVAANTGAPIARGQSLHFRDDDDWISDDAYRHFHELSQRVEAAWLYGMTQLLDRKLDPTIILKHGLNGNHLLAAMAGEWIPLQASLI